MNCDACNIKMKHRDYVRRIIKNGGYDICWVMVERLMCPICRRIRRNYPDYILPYKHYNKTVILDLISDDISILDLKYEDYPCELTVRRWKTQEIQSLI